MLRNREVRRALIACLLVTALGTVASYLVTRSVMLDALGGAHIVTASINEAASMATSGAPAANAALFAAICTLVTGLIVTVIFMILTNRRYRALANMAANLDRVLAGERDIRLRDMSEGELAILSSEIDKVIARLNLTVDELQAEKLALSDALADISHQLKTPLTSIAISTELIRDRLSARGDSEDLVERLRLIQTLQARVEDLVSALLKLARIDAGVIKLVCGDVDARELVRKSFEPLAIAFDIADVRFSADVQDGASYEGDLTWSVEALENILKNCMEHTPAGGCVSVRVTVQDGASYEGDLTWSVEALENILKNCMEHTPAGGCVSVRVTEDVLACRIRIEDTGPGIAESDLPHIFERFYRGSRDANATPSEVNPAGVGIGLALSKSLVTAQGGTLTAENLRDENGNITGAAFNLPGIAESDLPHIFERFYRGSRDANATPSEVNPAGVGIGLALSKSLVTAQGGTLTAENLRDENGNITGAAFNLVFFKTVV